MWVSIIRKRHFGVIIYRFERSIEPPSGFNKNRCKPARKSSSFSDNKSSRKFVVCI